MLFYYSVAKVNIIKLKQLTKSLFFYTILDFCSKLLYLCEIIIKSEKRRIILQKPLKQYDYEKINF